MWIGRRRCGGPAGIRTRDFRPARPEGPLVYGLRARRSTRLSYGPNHVAPRYKDSPSGRGYIKFILLLVCFLAHPAAVLSIAGYHGYSNDLGYLVWMYLLNSFNQLG